MIHAVRPFQNPQSRSCHHIAPSFVLASSAVPSERFVAG
jgi:hypothetical protein